MRAADICLFRRALWNAIISSAVASEVDRPEARNHNRNVGYHERTGKSDWSFTIELLLEPRLARMAIY